MLKRTLTTVVTLSLLVTLVAGPVFAADKEWVPDWPSVPAPDPIWRDLKWEYNEDYTKVTINGKTYNNYVMLARVQDEQRFTNFASEYLLSPLSQGEFTPDEYFTSDEGLKDRVKGVLNGTKGFYPLNEVLEINHKPWQESEFRDYIFDQHCYSSDEVLEFLKNSDNNGYAQEVWQKKKSLADAKKDLDLKKLPVKINKTDLYKTSEEADADYEKLGPDKDSRRDIALYNHYGDLTFTQDEFRKLLTEKRSLEKRMPVSENGETDVPEENSEDKVNVPENIQQDPSTKKTAGQIDTSKEVRLTIGSKQYVVANGKAEEKKELGFAPIVLDGTTFIPLRGVMESLGADVAWHSTTNEIVVTTDSQEVLLTIGSSKAKVNGENVTLDKAPLIKEGHTMIPLRFVAETLGYEVIWADGSITIK